MAAADPAREGDGLSVGASAVRLRGATLDYGRTPVWQDLDLDVAPGQFFAVLGGNGSGKTSLLRVLLGERALTSGQAWIGGRPVRRGSDRIGYVPQHVSVDAEATVKARDLVRMGYDGHRWGLQLRGRAATRRRMDGLLRSVAAESLGDTPVSMLSGGELQRVRVAAAIAADPAVLLCDEPLAALDLRHQQEVAALIDRRRREAGTAVLFVTHDINPVLDYVDQVLYLARGRFRVGPPDKVLTSAVLSDLYEAPVDVVRSQGRVIVVAAVDPGVGHHHSLDDHGAVHREHR